MITARSLLPHSIREHIALWGFLFFFGISSSVKVPPYSGFCYTGQMAVEGLSMYSIPFGLWFIHLKVKRRALRWFFAVLMIILPMPFAMWLQGI